MKQYIVGSHFKRIALDIAEPFPMIENGGKYILGVMDYFTKWVEIYAMANQEATAVEDILLKKFISRYGVPLEVHSDQGRNFENQLFQEICDKLGMKERTDFWEGLYIFVVVFIEISKLVDCLLGVAY